MLDAHVNKPTTYHTATRVAFFQGYTALIKFDHATNIQIISNCANTLTKTINYFYYL